MDRPLALPGLRQLPLTVVPSALIEGDPWQDGGAANPSAGASDAERILAGQPGYVSAHGYVKFVPTDTSEEKALDGAKVYVNFSKWNGGGWEYKWQIWDYSDGSGRYEFKDQSVTPGKWRIKGIMVAQGSYLQSESGWHEFTVKKGYRLRPKHSNKCMSASENKRANGTPIIQWDCSGSSQSHRRSGVYSRSSREQLQYRRQSVECMRGCSGGKHC